MDSLQLPIGEIAALACAALWAAASILWTRQMAVSRPVAMNLFKTAFCLPLFLLVLLVRGDGLALGMIGVRSTALLLTSGVIGMSVGDTCYFAGLARIGARRTMMIQTLAPIFAALLSVPLGQNLPSQAASLGIVLVLLGLLLVLREQPVGVILRDRVRSGILFALGAAFCQALGIVLTKEGLLRADILEASTIRIFGGVVGILVLESMRGRLGTTVRDALHPPALERIIPATLLGTFLAFFLMQAGVQYTEPAVAAALTGTSPLFVAPMSVIFLGEAMRIGGWTGTVLAVGGVVLMMVA
jgi:drug/metabolite transporter (DMT)-like permease